MARPRTALLSREIIARAAIRLVESGHELQIVPLARSLGVSASSIYHHVNGRDGVIHAMREYLVASYLLTVPRDLAWEDRLRREVEQTWRMYADHPHVLQHMITEMIDEPDVIRFYDSLADALTEAGVPQTELLTTIEVIDAFTFGAALDTLSPEQILDPERTGAVLTSVIQAHPTGKERNQRMFALGLDVIIAGIKARISGRDRA